jgi:hypothetical protein
MKISDVLERNIFLAVLISAFIFYGISAGLKISGQSKTPQYVYLASSFLQGRTDLVALPKSTYDLISFRGQWYVPGGITPALLYLPFVIIFGTTFSDVLFGVLLGALNVAMMYSLLTRLVEKLSTRLWLTILFAFGSTHWWLASVGAVWFNAQLVALLFMILYVRDTLQNKPWLAGLWLGLAFLSRPPTIFSAGFYLLFILPGENTIQPILKKLIPFGLMLVGSVTIMLIYNQLRFGNPLNFGYEYVVGSNALIKTYARSGGFNIQYMPCNIYVSLLGTPNIDLPLLPRINEVCSYLKPIGHDFGKLSKFFNPLGMSIFLTTPAFLLIFRARLRDNLVFPAWAGILGVLLPLWMYHSPGWVQFGYRYITDFMVFLFILLSRAVKQTGYLEKLLIGLSVIMGATGLHLMYYMNFGLVWYEMFLKMARGIYHIIYRFIF